MFDRRHPIRDETDRDDPGRPAHDESAPDEVLAIGAECLAALGHFAEARMQVEAALRVNPRNEKALALAAAISDAQVAPLVGAAAKRFLSNHLDEAEQLLRRALAIEPGHPQASRILASVLSRKQMRATAPRRLDAPVPTPSLPEPIPGSTVAAFPAQIAAPQPARRPEPQPATGVPTTDALTTGAPTTRPQRIATPRTPPPIDRPLLAGAGVLTAALVVALWFAPRGADEPESGAAGERPSPETAPAATANTEPIVDTSGAATESAAPRADPETARRERDGAPAASEPKAVDAPSSSRPQTGYQTGHQTPRRRDTAAAPTEEAANATALRPVADAIASARSRLAQGDWEAALAAAFDAQERSPQAPAVAALAQEILDVARSTARAARLQAGSVGATNETRFFANAAELIALGDARADGAFLLAARSYFVAADLFGRSAEQAQLRGIRGTLDDYVAAHEARDIERLRDVWPTLSGQTLVETTRRLRRAKSIEMAIDRCSTSLQEDRGAATCQIVWTENPRRGRRRSATESVFFTLRRDGSAWRIEDVRPPS